MKFALNLSRTFPEFLILTKENNFLAKVVAGHFIILNIPTARKLQGTLMKIGKSSYMFGFI